MSELILAQYQVPDAHVVAGKFSILFCFPGVASDGTVWKTGHSIAKIIDMAENSDSLDDTIVTPEDVEYHLSLWDKGQHPFFDWDEKVRQRFRKQLIAIYNASPRASSREIKTRDFFMPRHEEPAARLLQKIRIAEGERDLLEKYPSTSQINRSIERLSKADPDKIQEVVAAQLDLMQGYYQEVLNQSQRSFRSALVAAAVGLIFFLAAIAFALLQQPTNLTAVVITAIGGTLAEFIAALNFRLYGDASKQLAEFQSRLDKTQRYLLANSISSGLNEENRQAALQELVRTISGQEKLESNPTMADFPNRATI